MTPVPPPASPCVRCRLEYQQTDGFFAGSRFFLSYGGSTPTTGTLNTLATTIASAWASDIAANVDSQFTLVEVDVLDVTTDSGAFGTWTGEHAGTESGTSLPAQSATNVEFGLGRRYRGGKPRMFLPPGTTSSQLDAGHWSVGFAEGVSTAFQSFITAITTSPPGGMGPLAHVNLSYFSGFKNITNSSGRTRAVPQYRDAAKVDVIEGYFAKQLIGSQRRRRNATTP